MSLSSTLMRVSFRYPLAPQPFGLRCMWFGNWKYVQPNQAFIKPIKVIHKWIFWLETSSVPVARSSSAVMTSACSPEHPPWQAFRCPHVIVAPSFVSRWPCSMNLSHIWKECQLVQHELRSSQHVRAASEVWLHADAIESAAHC